MEFKLPHRMRDPVHAFIHYNDIEREIIDSEAFHRLRHIRQLSLTNYIYPGATHTRFEHSLGVMELAHRFFKTLLDRNEKEMREIFGKVDKDINYSIQILRISALVHDIGHLPFSHSGEELMFKNHVEIGREIIKDSNLTKIIQKIDKNAPTLIYDILGKNNTLEPKWLIIRKIISGEFDADRTDYLIRDSLHCGVEYGSFDYQRLLESIRLIENNDGRFTLGIERGGLHTLESLVISRYLMYTQIYFHRTRRIFDYYLKEFFREWIKGKITSPHDVLNYDDIKVINALREIKGSKNNNKIRNLSERIINRKPHSCLFETHDNVKDHELEAVKTLKIKLNNKYGDDLNIIMDTAQGSIHEFYTGKEHESKEDLIDLRVRDEKADIDRPVRRESPIIENLPRLLRVCRIYGDINEPREKKEIRNDCAKMARELYL